MGFEQFRQKINERLGVLDQDPALWKNLEKTSGELEFETTEKEVITLKWNICYPVTIKKDAKDNQIESGEKDEATLFLPGVAVESDSVAVLKSAQDFANASQNTTYAISTRINNPKTQDSQTVQAEAIRQFIEERGLRNVTIVGHSQGANKAIDLIAQLEQQGFNIRGLILTNPAGLYDQDPQKLTKKFFKDSTIDTPITLLKDLANKGSIETVAKATSMGGSALLNITKEAVGSPTQFFSRVQREATEAGTLNESAKRIKAPIVVVLGAKDSVFQSDKLIPETSHDQSITAQEERGEAMKKIFPNSADVKVLEATKLSNHILHYLRSKQVAETSMYMLRRMVRKQ